jgi:hypothetical protein
MLRGRAQSDVNVDLQNGRGGNILSQEDAAIIRRFGKATVTPYAESPLAEVLAQDSTSELKAPRQVIEIEQTMTSCGYGVPVMSFVRERRRDDRGRKYKEAQ